MTHDRITPEYHAVARRLAGRGYRVIIDYGRGGFWVRNPDMTRPAFVDHDGFLSFREAKKLFTRSGDRSNPRGWKDALMTDTRCTPGAVPLKAALAIINSTANPASPVGTTNVTARRLAEIIERETNVTAVLAAPEHVTTLVDPGVSPDAPWAIEKARTALAVAKASTPTGAA